MVARTVCLASALIAVLATGSAAQPPSFEAVVADLASLDPAVRVRALRQLDRSGYPEAAEAISALARDADDGLQLEAIGTTLRLLLDARIEGTREDPGGALAVFEAGLAPVVTVPGTTFGHLAAAMGDLHPDVRRQAAWAFAVLAGRRPATVPADALDTAGRALEVMLGAPEPAVRVTAARVAGALYRAPLPETGAQAARMPQPVADALIAQLNQAAEIERLVSMEALGLAREIRAVAALTERHAYHLRTGPPLERAATLDALARLGHPSSVPLFVAVLDDRWDALRQLGFEGLARSTARQEAAAALAGRGADRQAGVALAQAFARARAAGTGASPELVEALRVDRTRAQARGYLLELGPAPAASLAAALGHADPAVRRELVDVLGLVGTPDVRPALAPLTTDRDRAVASAAATAIRRIEAGAGPLD